ncbi:MAG: PEP-utilizing enzyme [Thermaerobacter sp.]|nr:PEP-utilizing enzyme [Thermaerobacter sp.]
MAMPPTPEFPVTWEPATDASLFWMRDVLHHPEPIGPLAGDMLQLVFEDGVNAALASYRFPWRSRRRYFNGYSYSAVEPTGTSAEIALERVRTAADGMGQAWLGDWLPEVQGHLAFWQGFDLDGASRQALQIHLEETVARCRRLGEVHFLASLPGMLATSEFEDLYADLVGSGLEAHFLLQGLSTKLQEMGRDLEQLARLAGEEEAVRRILSASPPTEMASRLAAMPAGSPFATAFHQFLTEYGQRSANGWEVDRPSWIEDPGPLLATLRSALASAPRPPAPGAAERERAVQTVLQRVQGDPRAERFSHLLQAARVSAVIKEDHNFWIDFAAPYQVRRVLQAWGRRLAADGTLAAPEDVFWLTLAELRESAAAPVGSFRRQAQADRRRADTARFAAVMPPPVLGTPPAGPLPDNPLTRAMTRVFGGRSRPPADDMLHGVAASAGVVRGPVRILRAPEEADRLRPGEILVARTTSPSWTPLFRMAAGVITDVGGVLSHSAVVAREYGIPAVVAVGSATLWLHDGQQVEVDGSAGTVRLLL